jgi:hypothetical protein
MEFELFWIGKRNFTITGCVLVRQTNMAQCSNNEHKLTKAVQYSVVGGGTDWGVWYHFDLRLSRKLGVRKLGVRNLPPAATL